MKCPTCRRVADAGIEECTRCGTDLSLLINLDTEHDRLIERGRSALCAHETNVARACFDGALKIRKSCRDARKGQALVELLAGNYDAAVLKREHIAKWVV